MGRQNGENGGKGTKNKKHNWWAQNRWGEVKNSIGNGEAKDPIYTTHGYELRGDMLEGGGAGLRGMKGRKHWDNCNSIINKICFKKKSKKCNLVLKQS